jgi:ubiquitin-protein ligase
MNIALWTLNELSQRSKNKTGIKPSKSKISKKKSSTGNGTGFGGTSTIGGVELGNRTKAFESQTSEDAELESALQCLIVAVESQAFDAAGLLSSLSECTGLRWILKFLLVNDSLLDIGTRPSLYRTLLNVIKAFSFEPFAAPYLTSIPKDEDNSACDLLESLAIQANTFLLLYKNQQEDQISDDESLSAALTMALDIVDSYNSVKQGCLNSSLMGITSSSPDIILGITSSAGTKRKHRQEEEQELELSNPVSTTEYVSALRPLKFEAISLCELIEEGLAQHSFLGARPAQYLMSTSGHRGVVGDAKKRLARVACEMSGLSSSLPVENGSSIFVRCDDTRMDLLKALIVGPEGTPYANGLFEFDILLPPSYPHAPPQVRLITTGGGQVRFNPNLYNCGKVCLSLLGTWSGPGWNPKESTLLQVLVSIQSLILVPDPFFNEPGNDKSRPDLAEASLDYSANIRLQTARHAILGVMSQPSVVFLDVIQRHFYHKRHVIEEQLQEWSELFQSRVNHFSVVPPVNTSSTSTMKGKGKKAAIPTHQPQSPFASLSATYHYSEFQQVAVQTLSSLSALVAKYDRDCNTKGASDSASSSTRMAAGLQCEVIDLLDSDDDDQNDSDAGDAHADGGDIDEVERVQQKRRKRSGAMPSTSTSVSLIGDGGKNEEGVECIVID